MIKLWQRLKNAAAALAGRTSAPAPAGGGKKPQLKPVEGERARGGFLASGAATPQKNGRLKEVVSASFSRFTTAQGGGERKKPTITPTAQKAGQATSPAKFAAKHKKSAPHGTQVAAKPKKEPAPQLKIPARATTAPPQLEPLAYPTTTLESSVTTVTPSSSVLDAALLNEMLSLQYRRCASSINEQEVL